MWILVSRLARRKGSSRRYDLKTYSQHDPLASSSITDIVRQVLRNCESLSLLGMEKGIAALAEKVGRHLIYCLDSEQVLTLKCRLAWGKSRCRICKAETLPSATEAYLGV